MTQDEAHALADSVVEGMDLATIRDAEICQRRLFDAMHADPRYDPADEHFAAFMDVRGGRRYILVRKFASRDDAQFWLTEKIGAIR